MKKIFFFFSLLLVLTVAAENIDINSYGAGKMTNPAREFYVSVDGKDTNDGKSLKSAWRTLNRGVKDLRAGDTLWVASGVYQEGSISLNVVNRQPDYRVQFGKPGAPIRVMGMPGAKVVVQPRRTYCQHLSLWLLYRDPAARREHSSSSSRPPTRRVRHLSSP